MIKLNSWSWTESRFSVLFIKNSIEFIQTLVQFLYLRKRFASISINVLNILGICSRYFEAQKYKIPKQLKKITILFRRIFIVMFNTHIKQPTKWPISQTFCRLKKDIFTATICYLPCQSCHSIGSVV